MIEQITLAAINGGLGDSLILSTLPERYARDRGIKVNITTINYPFRNQGIPDLVWRPNPYINEITKAPGDEHAYWSPGYDTFTNNIFYTELGPELNKLLLKYKNNIMAHEAYFGFEPINRLPRIYWQPAYYANLRNTIVVDPAGISMPFNKEAFEPFIHWQLNHETFNKSDMVLLESGKANYDLEIFPDIPRIRSKDIFDYASIINSCKIFLTSESGGAALASAIKGYNFYPKIHAVMSVRSRNMKMWKWENIEYWYTGKMGEDF